MHYYQFNIGDYRKDTGHLTPIEHYIYRTLLDWYYLDEYPITKETQTVMRRLSLDCSYEQNLLNVLQDFFSECEKGWEHKRVKMEINDYHDKAETNRVNGNKGGRPKKTQSVISGLPDVTDENPTVTLTNNQEPLTINQLKPKSLSGKSDATEILQYLNEKVGSNFKSVKSNIQFIQARFNEGATIEEMKLVIDQKTKEWLGSDSAKYLRPETLFNATKYAQYSGQISMIPIQKVRKVSL